jgi:hypothetical protein
MPACARTGYCLFRAFGWVLQRTSSADIPRPCYNDRARRNPSSTVRIREDGNLPHLSVRNARSTVITCETFATESLGRPASDAGIDTFPGASARRRFEVKTTAKIVRMRLRLKVFDWMISTGLRKAGPEAIGVGSCAHQTSPLSITTPHEVKISIAGE